MRTLYLAGLLYSGICGLAIYKTRTAQAQPQGEPVAPVAAFTGQAGDWFQAAKPFCNAVEVETHTQQQPPPPGKAGAGYSAACFALAGKVDRARKLILALPEDERAYAASIVFNIGHPVADAGDDRSAGPIMELVLEFTPQNYMAVYHAGMSEFALGQHAQAKTRLEQFLQLYKENDGWRSNAIEVLGRLGGPESP